MIYRFTSAKVFQINYNDGVLRTIGRFVLDSKWLMYSNCLLLWKNNWLASFFLTAFLIISFSINGLAFTIVVESDTFWSDLEGELGGLPTSADSVLVQKACKLTVDIEDALCAAIQVGGITDKSKSGTLNFSSSNSKLTVVGEVSLGDPDRKGFLDMTLGGFLKCASITSNNLEDVFLEGAGTIELTGNFTLGSVDSSNQFQRFNNLIISGLITLAEPLAIVSTLTINGSLITSDFSLTFKGDFVSHGNLSAGSSTIIIDSLEAQLIDGFATNGDVLIKKEGDIATFMGNVVANSITIDGLGEILSLGEGLTHVVQGDWVTKNGTLVGGSSTLKIGGDITYNGFGNFLSMTSTVELTANSQGQSFHAFSYYNLKLSNSGGEDTVTGSGTLNISNSFTTESGRILDMGEIDLSVNVVVHEGILKINSLSVEPITPNKIWGGTVNYNKTTGDQSIVSGTYAELTLGNISGNQNAVGSINTAELNNQNSSSTLDMGIHTLMVTAVNNAGVIKTKCTNSLPITPDITWGGTVNYYNPEGNQNIVPGTYSTLTLGNTDGTQTAVGDIGTGILNIPNGSTLNMSTFPLSAVIINNSGTIRTQNISSNPLPLLISSLGHVVYDGIENQTIVENTYGNLETANDGIKTLGGAITINGNFTIGNSTVLDVSSSNSYPIAIKGDWVNNGNFNPWNGSVTFEGASTILGNSISSFHDLTISPICSLTAPLDDTINVSGNWSNSSVFDSNDGTVIFNGNSILQGLSITSFNDVVIDFLDTLTAHHDIMKVTGNWTNNGAFFNNDGTVIFNSVNQEEKTISGGLEASNSFNNIAFDGGMNANWKLSNNLKTDSNFKVNQGTINQLTVDLIIGDSLVVNGGVFSGGVGLVTTNIVKIDGGTLISPSGVSFFNVSGDWILDAGIFKHNKGTVAFNGNSSIKGLKVSDFNNVIIDTLSSLTAHPDSMRVAGNWTNNGAFLNNDGTVIFNSGDSEVKNLSGALNGSNSFNNITFDENATANWTLLSDIDADSTFKVKLGTINQLTVDLTIADSLVVTGGIFIGGAGSVTTDKVEIAGDGILTAPTGPFNVSGSWNKVGGTFNHSNAKVTFNGTVGPQKLTSGANSFYDLGHNGAGSLVLQDALDVDNDISNVNGILDASNYQISVGGSWSNDATFTQNGNTVIFTSADDEIIQGSLTGINRFNNIIFSENGKWSFQDPSDIESDFSISNGTVVAPAGDLKIGGDFFNSGTFNHNNGNLILDGELSQDIGGDILNSTIFYNMTLDNDLGATLSHDIEIEKTLTLTIGNLDIKSRILTFGSEATSVEPGSFTFTSSNMIIADEIACEVRKMEAGIILNPAFTFPIGDKTGDYEYSPITLAYSNLMGSGYSSVRVIDSNHPQNASTTNYLTRYWTISASGYSVFSCYVTGTYIFDGSINDDVEGDENLIASSIWNNSLPWQKLDVVNTSFHQISASNVTSFGDFSGIDNTSPKLDIFTGTGDSTVCLKGTLSLEVTASGAPPFSHSWNTGESSSQSSSLIDIDTDVAGTFVFADTVTDGNGILNIIKDTITVEPLPQKPSFTKPDNSRVLDVCSDVYGVYFSVMPDPTVDYQWTSSIDNLPYLRASDTVNYGYNSVFFFHSPPLLATYTADVIVKVADKNTRCINSDTFIVNLDRNGVIDTAKVLLINNKDNILSIFNNDVDTLGFDHNAYQWGCYDSVTLDTCVIADASRHYQIYKAGAGNTLSGKYWWVDARKGSCYSKSFYNAPYLPYNYVGHKGVNSNTPPVSAPLPLLGLYPNPGNGSFTISMEGFESEAPMLSITDVVGKRLYNSRIDGTELLDGIFIKTYLARGIYFLNIDDEKGKLVATKFIIQ